MDMKIKLLGKTPEELKRIAAGVGLPAYTGGQMARWMYRKKVRSIEEMTDIPKAGREKLSEKYEVGVIQYTDLQISRDGTRKYLFPVRCSRKEGFALADDCLVEEDSLESGAVEAVMIPDDDRATLCVSSQSGCRMGCKFCMTGLQGFHGHLSVADILSQFLAVEESVWKRAAAILPSVFTTLSRKSVSRSCP